jgi:hypothetical protein
VAEPLVQWGGEEVDEWMSHSLVDDGRPVEVAEPLVHFVVAGWCWEVAGPLNQWDWWSKWLSH